MASITVKNIPDPLLERLRSSAAQANRSVNRQIIDCLERQLLPRRMEPEVLIERARLLRRRGPDPITIDELDGLRRNGRP